MRIAVKFAYDGRNFNGYARQPNLRTIEGEIIKNLKENNYITNLKEANFRSASRTDKGVSSIGNVFAFNISKKTNNILKNLNSKSEEIIFYGKKTVKSDFYPRHAKLRIYRYFLKKQDFDKDKIIKASNIFSGTHNFFNFAKIEQNKNPVRTIENIVFSENKSFLVIDFYAQTFLWHQIRSIVSALEKIGINKIDALEIKKALQNPEKHKSFGLADPKPLVLKDIIYDFEFKKNKDYLLKKEQFEKKLITSL